MSVGWGERKLCRGCGWYFQVAADVEVPETCGGCADVLAFELRHGMKPALERLRDGETRRVDAEGGA